MTPDPAVPSVEAITAAGSSRPWLVMVHGASQHRGLFAAQVDRFRDRYRLLLIDLPAHGRSSTMPGPYGIGVYTDAVRRALDTADVGRAHYWGTHTGAAVGLALAVAEPPRFSALVLEGAVIPGRDMPSVVAAVQRARQTALAQGMDTARRDWFDSAGWFEVIRRRPLACRAAEHWSIIGSFAGGPWTDTRAPRPVAPIADRLTTVTYPDSTLTTYAYDKLDLVSVKDRLGRVWTYTYDANRRLTKTRDPLGNETLLAYNESGKLTRLTDAKGNVTTWTYDVQNRLTSKRYADGRTVTYTYEATTSRLKSVIDALGQTKQYSYAKDDRVAGITYLNAVNSTPNVSFAYDAFFPRLVSMTDGTGTTQYSYVPVGSPGALQLAQDSGPLPSSAVTYAYDPLGRTASRTVAGSGAETFQYDSIDRLAGYTNDLGAFTLSYLGQTDQATQRQLASSTLATTWSYLANSGDRRLAGISHVGLSASNVSAWQFTTTPEDFITGVTETGDTPPVYPSPTQQTAAFNPLNQLTSLSAQTALSYSATGNLLSDGQRVFTWDAEDRLVGITWPAQPGRQVTFAYDGLNRRTTISSTPAGGGGTVTTSYVWCGESLCQVRNAANAVTRAYHDEGEFVPGAPAQRYYYGGDQIGSVRRVFASTGGAPAYAYDPYGVALQVTASLTDFGYAGMFWHADSGLYLTQYRAYDPTLGRWLSRDPLGEDSDAAANLYAYVSGNPITFVDPDGLFELDRVGGVVVHSNPGPQAGGKEHARHGPGHAYHVHIYDKSTKLEVRMSTETWKPLTAEDKEKYDKSKNIQKYCQGLTEPQKKFFDRVNREVFHRGHPTTNQLIRLGMGVRGAPPVPPRNE